jgi:hypothetical protein
MFGLDRGDHRAVGDKEKASKRVGGGSNAMVEGEKMTPNEGGGLKKAR